MKLYRWRCPKCGREIEAPQLATYQPELMCIHEDGPWMMKRVDKGDS